MMIASAIVISASLVWAFVAWPYMIYRCDIRDRI